MTTTTTTRPASTATEQAEIRKLVARLGAEAQARRDSVPDPFANTVLARPVVKKESPR